MASLYVERIGPYRLVRRLAGGGMGEVYDSFAPLRQFFVQSV